MICRLEPADLDGMIELMAQHAAYERASFDRADKHAALRQAFFAAPSRETMRGRGIGKALLQAIVEEARRQRIEHLEWQTPAWNEDAIRFYHREGATAASKARFSLRVS